MGRKGKHIIGMNSNKLLSILYICVLALIQPVISVAEETAADKAYAAGEYAKAILLMEQNLKDNGASSALYYNLGNAYSQSGNPAGAVLNYEKALRLDPGNSQARNNLHYTESLVHIANESLTDGKNIDPTPADPAFLDWLSSGIARLSSNVWSVLAVVMFFLFLAGCASYIYVSSVKFKKIGFFGAGVFLLMTGLACWFASVSKNVAVDSSMCVLMADEVSLRLDPSDEAKTVAAPLSAGTRLKILESAKDAAGTEWVRVYLNMEYTGWTEADEVARVKVN